MRILFLIAGFFITLTAFAVEPARINLNNQYDPNASLAFSHTLIQGPNGLEVYLQIKINRRGETLDDYYIIPEVLQDYKQKLSYADTLSTAPALLHKAENTYLLRLPVTAQTPGDLLFLVFDHKNKETNYYYDVLLGGETMFRPGFLLAMDAQCRPIAESYTMAGKPLQLDAPAAESPNYYGVTYKYEFPPADPPMKTDAQSVQRMLQIDSTFLVRSRETFSPEKPGLYFFQTDSTTLQGLSLRLTDRYFPETRTLDDVLGPLVYISTNAEREVLKAAENKKIALDAYLLDITRDQERARWLMRNYFQRVEEANRLFTHYKEGWKTDQGMTYILFGKPDEVYRTGKGEEWIYNKTDELSKITFTFARVKNLFTSRHFVLMRDRGYETVWFRTVDLWRKAQKEM